MRRSLIALLVLVLAWSAFMQPSAAQWSPSGSDAGRAARPQLAVLSTGYYSSCAIKVDGTAWCWGQDMTSLGSDDPHLYPVQVGSESDWTDIQVSSGTFGGSACGLQVGGSLWCWGLTAFYGSLEEPTQVGPDRTWVSLTVSDDSDHTCAITDAGDAWCWGANAKGQLGNGERSRRSVDLVEVSGDHHWVQLAADGWRTCGVDTDGALWCWGSNDWGALTQPKAVKYSTTPVRVGAGRTWLSVDISHTMCAIDSDHHLWCWSARVVGPHAQGKTWQPLARVGSLHWRSVSTALWSACGILADGSTRCFGSSNHGFTFGNGQRTPSSKPIPGASGQWQSFDLESGYPGGGCGIRQDNHAGYCWGYNGFYRVGIGDTRRPPRKPVAVQWLPQS